MTTIVGRPEWFGQSLPREYRTMLEHWWWCAIALLSVVYRNYGAYAVVWSLRHAVNPAYVYEGRHHLGEDTVYGASLVLQLRAERVMARHATVEYVHDQDYGNHYVTPLEDRAPYLFPAASRPDWVVVTPPPYHPAEVIEGEIEEPPIPVPQRGLTTLQLRVIERMNA